MHCARHRLHVGQLGVVDDLGVAYCTEQLNVEGTCHLKLNACLHAIIFLLHVCKRHILERVDVVMIEVLPVGHVVQTAVVGVDVEVHPCVLILVAQLCAEHALVLEVTHEVVVDLRSHERVACLWCAVLIANAEDERVAVSHVERRAKLQTAVNKLSVLALAV